MANSISYTWVALYVGQNATDPWPAVKRSLYRLMESLGDDTTVITGTSRLARELTWARARFERSQGRLSWRTPDVVPIGAWVRRVYQEVQERFLRPLPSLLTPLQERYLWETCIDDDLRRRGMPSLLNVAGAALQAQRANAILDDWGDGAPDQDARGLWVGEDAIAFRQWRKSVHRHCQQKNWILPSGVSALLVDKVGLSPQRVPQRAIFAGFHTLTRMQTRLVTALTKAGTEVSVETLGLPATTGRRHHFQQLEEELEAVARWARALLEQGTHSMGVVVPDLMATRSIVERSFEAVFESDDAYEISLTPALREVPVIRDALLLLRAARNNLSISEIEQILRSPFVQGADEEFHRRAMLVGVFRRMGKPQVSLRGVRSHLNSAPAFNRAFEKALSVSQTWPQRQSMARWTVSMSEWLRAFGWPGDGAHTTSVDQFQEVLTELAGLGMVFGDIDVGQALSMFGRMCAARRTRASARQAPIQVMTIEESIGLEFDQLWVTGLHDDAWPPVSRPNPFVPASWLRRYRVPHSSPDLALAFASQVSAMWRGAAKEVVFSFHDTQGERSSRASPMLRAIDKLVVSSLPQSTAATPRQQLFLARPEMEWLRDIKAPPVSGGEVIRGGTGVFKHQAACPFRGFATHRLGANPLETIVSGLGAKDRGSLVHDVLALVWNQLGSQATLLTYSESGLRALISGCVATTFKRWAESRPGLLAGRFAELERERLLQLVGSWLVVEKQRSAFVVDASETDRAACVGNIPITIRPDRIDRLHDGGLLIIDYKTGDAHRHSWFAERIDEPQLPLYCTAIDAEGTQVAGITFALVKMGKMKFSGSADRDDLGPGIVNACKSEPTGWQSLKAQWGDSLGDLASEFLTGYAAVAPSSANSCRTCALCALCRIREVNTLEPIEDDRS